MSFTSDPLDMPPPMNPSSSNKEQRRKFLPPVPKFENMGGSDFESPGPSGPSDDKKSFNVAGPSMNPFGGSSTANENKIEEEISRPQIGPQIGPQIPTGHEIQKSEENAANKAPKKIQPFAPNIDMSFINKLYADKDLANKEKKEDKDKEKKEVKKPVVVPKADDASIKISKLREEYDPARPNDYEAVLEDRRRRQAEEEERRQREAERIQEEESYIGLQEGGADLSKYPTMEEEVEEEPSDEEKIMKMLEKQGWKMGEGLGKNRQGMTTPLIAKKVTGNTAVIANSALDISAVLPQELVAKKAREAMYNMPPTRILVLLNMVTPHETIDMELRDEVIGEAQNYGKVLSCEICEMKNAPEDEMIRIFVEYEKKEGAVNGFSNLYGRFFAGRTIMAKFYDEKAYSDGNLYLPL